MILGHKILDEFIKIAAEEEEKESKKDSKLTAAKKKVKAFGKGLSAKLKSSAKRVAAKGKELSGKAKKKIKELYGKAKAGTSAFGKSVAKRARKSGNKARKWAIKKLDGVDSSEVDELAEERAQERIKGARADEQAKAKAHYNKQWVGGRPKILAGRAKQKGSEYYGRAKQKGSEYYGRAKQKGGDAYKNVKQKLKEKFRK